jgi:hypothetical protein
MSLDALTSSSANLQGPRERLKDFPPHHRRRKMNAIAYELAVARTADLLRQAEHRRMVHQVMVATHENGSRSTHAWRPRTFLWWNRDRLGSEAASVRP